MKLVLIFALFTAPVFAGDHAGTGGGVVLCHDSATMLDFWEHRASFPPRLGQGTALERVHFALNRLARLDRKRAQAYGREADLFFSRILWMKGPLEKIPDHGVVPIPEGCRIAQLAIQLPRDTDEGKRYRIDSALFARLDAQNVAGLILHEIIYREARELGQRDSIKSRLYNAIVCSDRSEAWDERYYRENVTDIVFARVPGTAFRQKEFRFDVEAESRLVVRLRDLLREPPASPLVWSIVGAAPEWAEIIGETLVARPGADDVGVHRLTIAVANEDGGAIAFITLTVTERGNRP